MTPAVRSGYKERHRPRNETAPIVADENRAIDFQRIEESDQIAGQLGKAVDIDGRRRARIGIASLIGSDRRKPAAATAGN